MLLPNSEACHRNHPRHFSVKFIVISNYYYYLFRLKIIYDFMFTYSKAFTTVYFFITWQKILISDDVLFTSQCEGVAGGRVVTSYFGVASLGSSC